jgi:hypothetical protein
MSKCWSKARVRILSATFHARCRCRVLRQRSVVMRRTGMKHGSLKGWHFIVLTGRWADQCIRGTKAVITVSEKSKKTCRPA